MTPVPAARGVIANAGAYYAGWLACVLGAAWNQWEAGAGIGLMIFVLHVFRSVHPVSELRLAAVVLSLGFAADSLQTAYGLLRFDAGQFVPWLAPIWIAVMWLLFATTLRISFGWLRGRPWLAAATGAIGGPAAFYAGERMGAVAFHSVPGLSLGVLAVVWALLMPLLISVASAEPAGSTQ